LYFIDQFVIRTSNTMTSICCWINNYNESNHHLWEHVC